MIVILVSVGEMIWKFILKKEGNGKPLELSNFCGMTDMMMVMMGLKFLNIMHSAHLNVRNKLLFFYVYYINDI